MSPISAPIPRLHIETNSQSLVRLTSQSHSRIFVPSCVSFQEKSGFEEADPSVTALGWGVRLLKPRDLKSPEACAITPEIRSLPAVADHAGSVFLRQSAAEAGEGGREVDRTAVQTSLCSSRRCSNCINGDSTALQTAALLCVLCLTFSRSQK